MLPVLPALGGGLAKGVSGGARMVAGGAKAGAKTAGRAGARSSAGKGSGAVAGGATNAGANSGGAIQLDNQNLQEGVSHLQEATKAMQKFDEEQNKSLNGFNKMGAIINKNLVTPLNKATRALSSGLRTIRNMAMALGALGMGTFLLNTRGTIDRQRKADQGGVSYAENIAFNRAKSINGLQDGEFNLANLQSLLGSEEGYGVLAGLGLNRDELAGMDGKRAMEMVRMAIRDKLSQIPKGGVIDNALAERIQKASGVDVTNVANRELFKDEFWDTFEKDFKMFKKTIGDTKILKQSERNIAIIQAKLKDLGAKFSISISPYVNQLLDKVIAFLNGDSLQGADGIIEKVFETLGNAVAKISKVFNASVINSALDSLTKIGSAMMDIVEQVLPYFLKGLEILGGALQELAQFLQNPKDYIKEKGSNLLSNAWNGIKDITSGVIAQWNGYGQKLYYDKDGNRVYSWDNKIDGAQITKRVDGGNIVIELKYKDGSSEVVSNVATIQGGGGATIR